MRDNGPMLRGPTVYVSQEGEISHKGCQTEGLSVRAMQAAKRLIKSHCHELARSVR